MAKLFKPEDFDKHESSKTNWKIILWLGIIVVIIIIVLFIKFGKSDNTSEITDASETITVAEEIVDSVSTSIENTVDSVTVANQESEVEQVSETTSQPVADATPKPSSDANVDDEALKVIRGDYGNNPVRKKLLGNRYQDIQSKVNQLKKEGVF